MKPYHTTYQNVHHHVVSTFANIETWFLIPADAWTYKPKDEGWTIGEILEHMTLTNHFLLIVIENGVSKALKRASTHTIKMGESDLEALGVIGHPDAFPWMRPDHMVPTGQKTRDEIQVVMNQHFVQSILLLKTMPKGARTGQTGYVPMDFLSVPAPATPHHGNRTYLGRMADSPIHRITKIKCRAQ